MSEQGNEENEKPQGQSNAQKAVDMAKEQGKQAVQKMAKEGIKKGAAKVGGHAVAGAAGGGAATGALAAILPYLLIALLVILIIMIIIGIVAFLLTMPGMFSGKISAIFEDLGQSVKSLYAGSVNVSNSEVMELANYIEDMEYDLIGYGFVRPNADEDIKTTEQLTEDGYEKVEEENPDYDEEADEEDISEPEYLTFYEDEDGNRYSGSFYNVDGTLYGSDGKPIKQDGFYTKYGIQYDEDGNIQKILDDSSILRTYAMSQKRMFVLRNDDAGFLKRVVRVLIEALTGYSGSWAQGLIEIHNAEDGISSGLYGFTTPGWSLESIFSSFDSDIEITDNNQLKIKKGWGNNPILFELDGWSGRYGLSQDFLISLHLATLSPDLVTTIAQTFDTRIQVYLDYVKNAEITAYFHTSEMTGTTDAPDGYAEYQKLEDEKKDGDGWFDGWFLSKEEAKTIMDKYGIPSCTTGKYTCGGNDPTRLIYISSGSSGYDYVYDANDGNGVSFAAHISEDDSEGAEITWSKDVIYDQYSETKSNWAFEYTGFSDTTTKEDIITQSYDTGAGGLVRTFYRTEEDLQVYVDIDEEDDIETIDDAKNLFVEAIKYKCGEGAMRK